MPTPFVHLHLHTEYSLLDGAVKIRDLFKRCDELGMPAVAMTDHGNMFAACKFDAEAIMHTLKDKIEVEYWAGMHKPYKVKPIFGCEFYVCDNMNVKATVNGRAPRLNHIVLLAKNYEGFLNLCQLNAEAYIRGFYYKPRIDTDLLSRHTGGLLCLSACLAGEVPQALLHESYDAAKKVALRYKSMFADGDYYIEIQDHDISDQKQTNPSLIRIAQEIGVKVVATNDVHYLRRADSEMQKVLQCISFKRQITDTLGSGEDTYFPTDEFYLKSGEEMEERFGYIPESLSNTLEVADKCNCLLEYKQDLIPSYSAPDGLDSYEFLRKLTYEGLAKKYPAVTPEIKERAEYELTTIHELGYVDYFLIVWDFIHYAESMGISVGPGRGSGVGSIVAFAVGITKVEPLRYNLFFERFLNRERVSMPDFDIDFCFERRGDVIKYVIEKYGADHVSQIVTFGTLAMKAAIKDVGRVYGIPYSETDKITKAIPPISPTAHIRLTDLLGWTKPKADKGKEEVSVVSKELCDIYSSDESLKKVLDMACKIEGFPRQTGMHAAGVVICKDKIADHIPQARSGDDITTQFDMVEVEKLGMLKMDFLGLRTLTDISKTVEIIEQVHGKTVNFYQDFSYDDPKVYELISGGDTHAVFQLESEGMKKFMRRLRPTCMEDIIAGISLYRPGPMDSIDEYVENKNNPSKIKFAAPCLKDILGVTYGILVYQEQVIKILQEMAGYTMGGADILRRAMSKKKKDVVSRHREVFVNGGNADGKAVDGAEKRGISVEAANGVYDKIDKFAEYAFNKSHAAAYAYVSYQTAYLKCYYKAEYLTAVLNNRIANAEELKNYLPYAKNSGIKILPPSVNFSKTLFSVEDGSIRVGLSAVKGVGIGVMEKLVEERERGGAFADPADFFKRVSGFGINKKVYEALILVGALDCFCRARAEFMQIYSTLADKYASDRAAREAGQFSMFETIDTLERIDYPKVKEFDYYYKLKQEKELIGTYVTGHPLDQYRQALSGAAATTELFLATGENEEGEKMYENIADGQPVKISGMLVEASRILTKKNQEMGVGKLEDLYGSVDLTLFSRAYSALRTVFTVDTMVTVTGKASIKEGFEPKLLVDKIVPFDGAKQEVGTAQKVQILYIRCARESSDPAFEEALGEILEAHEGESDVIGVEPETKQKYKLDYQVTITQALLLELTDLIGGDNVKVLAK